MAIQHADGVIIDYMSQLLQDSQLQGALPDSEEPVLRFAHVAKGYELIPLWRGELSPAQAVCRRLWLLSMAQALPESRLKRSLLANCAGVEVYHG